MRRTLIDVRDLLSIGAPAIGLVCLVVGGVAGVVGVWWLAVMLWSVSAVTGLLTWAPRRRIRVDLPVDGVRLVAGNLWYGNADMAAAARSLLAEQPDVLVVSELSEGAHEVLAAAFAHHEILRLGGAAGHGVYSRFPLERLEPPPQMLGQALWLEVSAPRPFHLCGAHMPRPVVLERPREGTERLAGCRAAIERMVGLVDSVSDAVIAGDLNLSDRQPAYSTLVAGRLDAMRTGKPSSTFLAHPPHVYWRLLAMRIDHLVVPAGWRVSDARAVSISGSDHRAVCATIAPPV